MAVGDQGQRGRGGSESQTQIQVIQGEEQREEGQRQESNIPGKEERAGQHGANSAL